MNTFAHITAVAALLAASAIPALADTIASPSQGTIVAPATTAIVGAAPATTASTYRNDDALRGLYDQRPLISQCALQTPNGPLPGAFTGQTVLPAQYEFLMDFDFVGAACRKPF